MARRKNILLAAAVLLAAALVFCFFKIKTPDEYYKDASPLWEGGPAVTLSIECEEAVKNYDKLDEALKSENILPEDGMILAPLKVGIEDGESVYSVLLKAAKYYKIPLDIQGAGENSLGTAYIRGINHLYEFSCGEMSGWMYSVNGKYPSQGCESFCLKDGDAVRILYTCDLGKDIGGDELD